MRLFTNDFQMDGTGLRSKYIGNWMEYWKKVREEVEIPTTSLLGTNENMWKLIVYFLWNKNTVKDKERTTILTGYYLQFCAEITNGHYCYDWKNLWLYKCYIKF